MVAGATGVESVEKLSVVHNGESTNLRIKYSYSLKSGMKLFVVQIKSLDTCIFHLFYIYKIFKSFNFTDVIDEKCTLSEIYEIYDIFETSLKGRYRFA